MSKERWGSHPALVLLKPCLRIEAVDTTGNHCADYSEFFAFCKLQVDSLLGQGKP